MDIMQAAEGLRQHFEAFAASAREKLEQELPVVADVAAKTAANPAFAAMAAAVHLGEAPEVLQVIADFITKTDAAIAAAKVAGAAEALQAAQAQAPVAEPDPAQPEA